MHRNGNACLTTALSFLDFNRAAKVGYSKRHKRWPCACLDVYVEFQSQGEGCLTLQARQPRLLAIVAVRSLVRLTKLF
jgi:hypothetical protein